MPAFKKNMPGCGASGGCGCVSGKVLLWLTNIRPFSPSFTTVRGIWEAMGLTVHTNSTWSGTLSDYGLIVWPGPASDPTWWSQITGGTWSGRFHFMGDTGFTADSNPYINSRSGVTGLAIVDPGSTYDIGCNNGDGTIEADDLASGMSVFKYGGAREVTGGTPISKTETGNVPWISRNTIGTIDFVLSGDTNHMEEGCVATHFPNNEPFVENLWTVPV